MVQVLHMHANLILTSRFELTLHKRVTVLALQCAIVGDGLLASVIYTARQCDSTRPVCQPRHNCALTLLHIARHECNVAAVEHEVVPVVGKHLLHVTPLGKEEKSRRTFIETMNSVDSK